MKLSTNDLKFFSENGYLVIRDAVNEELIADLVNKGDRLVESEQPFFRTSDREFDGFRNLLSLDSSFLKLVDIEKALVPIIQILGFNVHLSSVHQSYIYPRDLEQPWEGDWHTDIFGFENDLAEGSVRVGIKCAFPLTSHSKADSGMTIIIPGSHKWDARRDLDNAEPSPQGSLQLNIKAGDCLIFENRLQHSRGINLSSETRKCILVGYTHRWVIPLDAIDDYDVPDIKLSDLAKDLLPRPYRVEGNGAIASLCSKHNLPLRPAEVI